MRPAMKSPTHSARWWWTTSPTSPRKQGALVALDATTGKELWVHQFGAGGRFSGIAGQRGANYWESKDRSDRRIFVTSGGMLHAIDARPASWSTPSPTTASST